MTAKPPVAARKDHSTVRHGETMADPYHWLRDQDWQRVMREPEALTPEIRDYLEAENAYTDAILAPLSKLRQDLVAEMKGRIKQDDSSVPTPDGAYEYYRRFETGAEYPRYCRRKRDDAGSETVLLDCAAEAEGEEFFRLGDCEHRPDHGQLAYSVDLNGSEYYTVHIADLESGDLLPDRIERIQGEVVWSNDGKWLFYILLDDNHRPSKVFRHRIGDDAANDALVYEETDPAFYLSIWQTESRRFVAIEAQDHSLTGEVRVIDADDPTGEAVLVAARESGVDYEISERDGQFLILTNADGAEDFKIATAPAGPASRETWQDLIPHQPGRLIKSMLVFKDFLARLEMVDALPRIVIRRFDDGSEHEIAFEEEAYDLGLMPGYEYDTTTLRFAYSSPATPTQVFDYDMATRERTLRKQEEIPSGHDPEAYVVRRLSAKSHDGTDVPVTVLHAKDTAIDGSAPLLLYGYGSYGLSIPASFAPNRFSLVDRGFVYAIAHIRGGRDRGQHWYLNGKLASKKNTFLDFIAAGEHLIAENYSSTGALVAHGGSAGGMLVGAVANMRPDLFKGIVADVPFVDVINTMCDADLPLTPGEWSEWGDPITDETAFRYMKSYSPYDNVAAQDYPNILAMAGLTDPRVTYWEPAKWIARLRATKTDDNLTLLHTNMHAGHAGASGRFSKLDEVALIYAFALLVSGKAG